MIYNRNFEVFFWNKKSHSWAIGMVIYFDKIEMKNIFLIDLLM